MVQWIVYACASAFLAGLVPVFMKSGARRAAPALAAALFALLSALGAGGVLLASGVLPAARALTPRVVASLVMAGLFAGFGILCLFRALSGGRVAKVAPITNFSSVLVTIVVMFMFEGWLGLWRWVFILVALLGTVLMEAGGDREPSLGWLPFAGLAALFFAASQLTARLFAPHLEEPFLHFFLMACAAAALLAVALLGKSWRGLKTMGFENWMFLLLSAIAASMSWLTKLYSVQLGDWSLLQPVACLTIVVTMVFSRLCNKERLSGASVLGLALTVLGMFALYMNF